MRAFRLAALIAVVIGVLATTQAQAQGRSVRNRGFRKAPAKQPKTTPSSSSQASAKNAERCQRIKDALNGNSRKMSDLRADSARYSAEYTSAQARIRELEQLRKQIDAELRSLAQRLKWEQKAFDKKCKNTLNCGVYERYVDGLEGRMRPLEAALANIQGRITATNMEIASLERSIPPVQRDYARNGCHALKPGETTQGAIDKCFSLMSDWNRFQTRINDLRDSLPALQASYISYSQRLAGMQEPLDEYSGYLNSFCKSSAKVAKVRELRTRKDRYNKLGHSIKQSLDRLNRLKGVKITVQSK